MCFNTRYQRSLDSLLFLSNSLRKIENGSSNGKNSISDERFFSLMNNINVIGILDLKSTIEFKQNINEGSKQIALDCLFIF